MSGPTAYPPPRILVFGTPIDLERAAAEFIAQTVARSIRTRGECRLILSGGETPRGVYRQLASASRRIAWERVHLLFGDERIVPPTDPLSTFGMVRTELLSRISGVQVHRVQGELHPVVAAERYEQDLAAFLRDPGRGFDLAVLGIGEDGHTASLFPTVTAPASWSRPIAAVPGPRAWRVTMTPSALNTAREVLFLATGERKATIVRQVLDLHEPTPALPASLIRPRESAVVWMLDRAAAAALPPNERSAP